MQKDIYIIKFFLYTYVYKNENKYKCNIGLHLISIY